MGIRSLTLATRTNSLKTLVREISIFCPDQLRNELHPFFEVLPPGYKVRKEVIEGASLIDLENVVMPAYTIGNYNGIRDQFTKVS